MSKIVYCQPREVWKRGVGCQGKKNNITGGKIIIGSNTAQNSAGAPGDARLSGKGDHSSVIDRFYLPGNVNRIYVLFRLDQCNQKSYISQEIFDKLPPGVRVAISKINSTAQVEPRLNVVKLKCQVRHSKFTEEFTVCEMGSDMTLGKQCLTSNKCLVDFGRAKLLLGKVLVFVDHNGLKIEQKIISCNTVVTDNNKKSLNIANSKSVESLSDQGR
mgnify:CR=1 FL=1